MVVLVDDLAVIPGPAHDPMAAWEVPHGPERDRLLRAFRDGGDTEGAEFWHMPLWSPSSRVTDPGLVAWGEPCAADLGAAS